MGVKETFDRSIGYAILEKARNIGELIKLLLVSYLMHCQSTKHIFSNRKL